MDYRYGLSLLVLLLSGVLENVNGYAAYEWIKYEAGNKIPSNAALLDNRQETYVGRARHYDEILPAEVHLNRSATIYSCGEAILKTQFDILTITKHCVWKPFNGLYNIDDTVIGGSAWNGEPIYIGSYLNIYNKKPQIGYIYSKTSSYGSNWKYLSCVSMSKWIDSSSKELPKNTIYGGKSEDGYDIYVARLKRHCKIASGQVIPELGIAMGLIDDNEIQADHCQVLVGEPDEYSWVSVSDGKIPDYAVVSGYNRREIDEIAYVARFNKTLTNICYSVAFSQKLKYDVLVQNHQKTFTPPYLSL